MLGALERALADGQITVEEKLGLLGALEKYLAGGCAPAPSPRPSTAPSAKPSSSPTTAPALSPTPTATVAPSRTPTPVQSPVTPAPASATPTPQSPLMNPSNYVGRWRIYNEYLNGALVQNRALIPAYRLVLYSNSSYALHTGSVEGQWFLSDVRPSDWAYWDGRGPTKSGQTVQLSFSPLGGYGITGPVDEEAGSPRFLWMVVYPEGLTSKTVIAYQLERYYGEG